MVRRLTSALLLSMLIGATGCFHDAAPTPTMSGIYKLEVSDTSIHHGVDILVLNSDSTYVHLYTKGSSKKDLMQSGTWMAEGTAGIVLDKFVSWDLGGPLDDGVMYPDPEGIVFSLSQDLDGKYEINADPKRGEKFVQIDRFVK